MPAQKILASLDDLAMHGATAIQVLRLIDDPDTTATRVAAALAGDPVLAARVLALANSSYYGLTRRIGALPLAVSVIGFDVVRGLAVAGAAGLDRPGSTPAQFWPVAARTAAAAQLMAPQVGADAGEAFLTGLLHTFGAALLHRHHPLPGLCLPEPVDGHAHDEQELGLYGLTHSEAAGKVLAGWQLPDRLVAAVCHHHDALAGDADPLQRALAAGRSVVAAAIHQERQTSQPGSTDDAPAADSDQGRSSIAVLTPVAAQVQLLADDAFQDGAFRQRFEVQSQLLVRALEPA